MKRLLMAGLMAAGLTACTPSERPVPEVSVSFGTSSSREVSLPAKGSWTVTDLPSWLEARPASGEGPVAFTLVARRPALHPGPVATGAFRVQWRDDLEDRGVFQVNVDARMYRVSGRVTTEVSSSGSEASVRGGVNSAVEAPAARGVIVKYRSRVAFERATVRALSSDASSRVVVLAAEDAAATAQSLQGRPDVEYAVPNRVLRALGTSVPVGPAAARAVVPTDQYAPLQWGFRVMGYGAVWQDQASGAYTRPVTVAVVDTGTRFDHPDLAGVQWGPGEGALDLVPETDNGDGNGVDRDPTDPGAPNRDPDSHGTHVAGILAARWGTFGAPCAGCSTSGVVGAVRDAPVKLLPLRVLDAFGNGDIATITQAVRYAAGETVTLNGTAYRTPHAAQIINLSLGGPVSAEEARPLCDAVAEVTARGVLVVAAAGNDGNRPPQTATGMSQPYYPAACEGAVSVAAVTLSEGLPVHAAYSSFYPQVMLSAPGGSTARALNGAVLNGEAFQDAIFSTSWDFERNRPNYVGMIGTSQAAPQVSAVAALMLSKGVVSNRSDLVARLQATARDLGEAGRDARTGFGLVDAAAALGAPAVESSLRVLLETRTQGVAPTRVSLPLEESGAFSGFVRGGPYRVVALLDSDGDGLDESGEPRGSVEVAVGEQNPEQEVTVRLSR